MLLPAANERLVKTAQAIFGPTSRSAAIPTSSGFSYDPETPARSSLSNVQQEVSSLGTLWMVRSIQLGHETGLIRY